MKKLVSFDQIREEASAHGLDGAVACAFPFAENIVKDGLIGLPFGTVEIDGKGWDWILKNDHYVFIEA